MEEKRILIIEDSPSQAAIIASVVKEAGFQPAVYSEIEIEIAQMLEKEVPELVLLDLKLLNDSGEQVADGFQICREIKRYDAKLPVIVVSAESDEDAREWAVLQGADDFLPKPFVVKDLQEMIRKVLREESAAA